MTEGQVVTISFFKYKGLEKWWGLRQMQEAQAELSRITSLKFFKLLGSGAGNGFSIIPDLSTYSVLCVWDSLKDARKAISKGAVFRDMYDRARYQFTTYMQSIRSRGSWDQQQPFDQKSSYHKGDPIAVLTRASIDKKKLFSFWRHVPKVSRKVKEHEEGIAFTKGVGELPWFEQATFSIWHSREKMVDYAYKSESHKEMIRKTRKLKWYTEELFAEFKLISVEQNWPDFSQDDLSHLPIPEQLPKD